ncbi:DUF4430 domain-containing protein [Ammoniphilus resinae]|uniref:Cytoskeletal protein RodZ n=1 Tax=Ammoniphilus resinae TaxID=861532 RepID=A0ABS4GQL7_9BACL|nr:DUF4430 domain-containing protein [Ammoniphilus resinae]MBP1932541.1 cytoskeletal protein RodZ [Ammoniphilus resinae]
MGRFYIILSTLILLVGCGTESTQPTSPTTSPPKIASEPAKVEATVPPTKPSSEASPTEPAIPSDQEATKPSEQTGKESEPAANRVQPTKQPEQPSVQPTVQPKKEQPEATKPAPSQPAPAPTPQPTTQPEPQVQTVTVSVVADQQQVILGETQVELKDGENVLDVLKRITREKKIQMEFSGSGSFAYVEGINNIYEFDRGPKSGWMYRVNGTFGGKSAGATKIKTGDRIEWLYTLDLGKDLERGSSQ